VADHALLPNYHQGFGAVHLPSTLPRPGASTPALEFVDSWQRPALQFRESAQRFRFRIQVEAGAALRMCLVYTDLPGRALQNDLSVLVEDPTGRKFTGNAGLPASIHRSDVDNNVEVIRVDEPEVGDWLIQVFARNLLRGPQDFAFVVTGALASALLRVPG
jgi:hypothetical protein